MLADIIRENAPSEREETMRRATILFLCATYLCLSGCEEGTETCECGDAACDAACDAGCTECDTSCDDSSVQPAEGDEEALRRVMAARRSIRSWTDEPLTRADVEALFWAAQGITAPDRPTGLPGVRGYRTSPSAGATYPLEVYVVAENVEGLDQGVHWYRPLEDAIEAAGPEGSLAAAFGEACNDQPWVTEGAANFVITGVHDRTVDHYGGRGVMYVNLEVGHAAQNMMLMAVARGLGTVAIGAFHGTQISELLELPEDHSPVYVITVGHPAREE